jgi:hypothetical protein
MQLVKIQKNMIIDVDAIIYVERIGVNDGEYGLKIAFSSGIETILFLRKETAVNVWELLESRALSYDEYAEEYGIEFS